MFWKNVTAKRFFYVFFFFFFYFQETHAEFSFFFIKVFNIIEPRSSSPKTFWKCAECPEILVKLLINICDEVCLVRLLFCCCCCCFFATLLRINSIADTFQGFYFYLKESYLSDSTIFADPVPTFCSTAKECENNKTLYFVTIVMICSNLASLSKFQYFWRPIYNPVEHLWWNLFCKNSKPLGIFIKKLHHVLEVAPVDLSKIYFLKNAKKKCEPNNRDLNRDWKSEKIYSV